MISKEETKKLKALIGFRHISQIGAYLIDKNARNRYGMPFSSIFISSVFNGKVENKLVEENIWSLVEKIVKENKEEQKRRKEILKKADEAEKATAENAEPENI